jgi:hypothetical protein
MARAYGAARRERGFAGAPGGRGGASRPPPAGSPLPGSR